jgi:uncharacterized membrane-anchored protein
MTPPCLPLRRTRLYRNLFALCLFAVCSVASFAQDKTVQSKPIEWHTGPYVAKLGTVAEINIPAGYQFADAAGARRFMELTHNPPSDQEVGIVTPIPPAKDDKDSKKSDDAQGTDNEFWFVLFDFDSTGYVKDDEKKSIDADKLFESMKKGTEEENEARKQRGWTAFHLTSWQTKPFYDETTNNLTWATLGTSDDPKEGQTVNYSTRALGRRGLMSVDLVLDPSQIATVVPKFKGLMTGFSFEAGSRYADFVKGDKVAEYGLTALIAGGAAAVALKTGFFAKLLALGAGLWKVIVVGFAALMTRIKNIFAAIKRKFSNEEKAPTIDDR